METKSMFASLMEDDASTAGPSSASYARSLSPFRTGRFGGRRSSHESSVSTISSVDDSTTASCVARETAPEDCARHRFIVWAAVKRNSSTRMTSLQRLECPLARCKKPFPNHELMLRHLADCDFLASGEYWCYEHGRVERFDDVKCKRCLGHPSKRRKMLSMAKSFFHSLGHTHKPRKGQGVDFDVEDPSLPPPSYDSLETDVSPNYQAELSATEIVEIDSTELRVTAPTHSIDPQALLIPELDSTAIKNDSFMQWESAPLMGHQMEPVSPMPHGDARHLTSKPTLQLTTHGLEQYRHSRPPPRPVSSAPRKKGLSPSSSVRSTTSTTSNASNTSNVSSLISPASAWSGAWSMGDGFNTNLTTPTDLVSPDGFHQERSLPDELNAMDQACQLPDFPLHDVLFELPAECSDVSGHSSLATDPLVLSFAPSISSSIPYVSGLQLTDTVAEPLQLNDAKADAFGDLYSDTSSLVASAWATLKTHIASSVSKTEHLANNLLTEPLRSLNPTTIAAAGIQVLKSLLHGVMATSALDLLCFVHLSYAFSLVVHEERTAQLANDLYLQALSYADYLEPFEQQPYVNLVYNIWEPTGLSDSRSSASSLRQSRCTDSTITSKGKQTATQVSETLKTDPLLGTVRNFLDELEMTVVFGQNTPAPEVFSSGLYNRHCVQQPTLVGALKMPFAITVKYIISMLLHDFADSVSLSSILNVVNTQVDEGSIASVRRLELELLQAGKACLVPRRFFTDFVPSLTKLCDSFYRQHEGNSAGREVFYLMDVDLLDSILKTTERPAGPLSDMPISDDSDAIETFFNEIDGAICNGESIDFMNSEPMVDVFDEDMLMHEMVLKDTKQALQPPTLMLTPDSPLEVGTPSLALEPCVPTTSHPVAAIHSRASSLQDIPNDDVADQDEDLRSQQATGAQDKTEADACCEICGYRPKGHPQWFRGSMAKHKKLQHSAAPPRIFKCPYPGCTSQYKNRPDNLRQHQIEKCHFVGDEGTSRRPSKRKKTTQED